MALLATRERRGQVGSKTSAWAAAWREKIRLAEEFKRRQYGYDAAEAMKFFNSDHAFLWDRTDPRSLLYNSRLDSIEAPDFRMTYNCVAELVQLFGPTMYHRNPVRKVNPRQPVELPRDIFVKPELENQLGKIQRQAEKIQQQMLAGMSSQGGGMMLPPGGQPPGGPPTGGPPVPPPPLPPQIQMMMEQLQQQIEAGHEKWQDFGVAQQQRYAREKTAAELMERMLNYTPSELDLKSHMRMACDEALIKGMSGLTTQLYTPPGSDFVMVGSFWESDENILFDPDALDRRDCWWMTLRRIEPVWRAEQRFGRKKGSLKGNMESLLKGGDAATDDWAYKLAKQRGTCNDLICYYEVYSKMGMGSRLKGMDKFSDDVDKEIEKAFDDAGDFCYFAVADGNDSILNLPDKLLDQGGEAIYDAVQWPIPFWADGGWPTTLVYFHDVPGQIYPMSHVKPALGEIRFVDFCMSFLAQKVRTVCDDLMGCVKAAEDEIREYLQAPGVNGYKLVGVESSFGKSVSDLISFLPRPPFHGDIWRMLAEVMEMIQKRLGLTELAYGMSSRQLRSAAEANTKQQNFSIRPDDMANKVEDSCTEMARKEAIASRYHLRGEDVAPVLGDEAALLWDELLASDDVQAICREYEYRIEAGSSKKPNKDRDAANMQQGLQVILPFLERYAMATGNFEQVNHFFGKWWDTMDMPADMLPRFEPPPKPEGPPPQVIEMQMKQQEAASKQQLMQQDMQARQQEAQVAQQSAMADLAAQEQKTQLELFGEQRQLEIDSLRGMMDLQHQRAMNKIKTQQAKAPKKDAD